MISAATYPLRIVRRIFGLLFERSLYLMWVPEFGFIQKVKPGISSHPKSRLMSVRAESGMNARLVIHFPLPAARYWEAALLRAMPALRDVPAHAGQTEWRKSFNAVTAVIVWLFLWAYDVDGRNFVALAILVAPIPADAFLMWAIVIILSYTAAGSVVYAAGWFILQMI